MVLAFSLPKELSKQFLISSLKKILRVKFVNTDRGRDHETERTITQSNVFEASKAFVKF